MYWFLVSISYVLYVNISFRSFVFVIDFENVARFQRNISKICLKWTKWLYLLTFHTSELDRSEIDLSPKRSECM